MSCELTLCARASLSLDLLRKARCLRWSASNFSGHWLRVVTQTLRLLHNNEFSERLDIHSQGFSDQDDSWGQEQAALWNLAWALLVELSSARSEL